MINGFIAEKLAWLRQVAGDAALPPQAMRLAAILAIDFVNSRTREAWPAVGTLAELLGVTPNTARSTISALEHRGHLRVSPGGGRRNTSRYRWVIRANGVGNTEADCSVSDAKPSSPLSSFRDGNPPILDAETLQSSDRNPPISRAETPQEIGGEPYEENPKKEPREGNPPSRMRARAGSPPNAADPSSSDADAYDQAFAALYSRWPRQSGEVAARRAFQAAVASGVDLERVARGAAAYIADRQRDRRGPAAIIQFTAPLARWLEERAWQAWADLPEAEQAAAQSASTDYEAMIARGRSREARRKAMLF